jgi:hypothetical protein
VRAILGRHAGQWVKHSALYRLANAGRGAGGGVGNFNRLMDALRATREVERDVIKVRSGHETVVYRLVVGA